MRLSVHFIGAPADESGYLLLKAQRLTVGAAHLASLPLTNREREVLDLVVRKTKAEIGLVLGISTRTVQKHLVHIFEKLGVETRTAASVRALAAADALGRPLIWTEH